MSDLSGRTTVVVGASRGLGRGIARAFAEAGAPVVAVARPGPALAELATPARTSGPRSRMRATRRWRGACWTSTGSRIVRKMVAGGPYLPPVLIGHFEKTVTLVLRNWSHR
jgi:NAD(P)-dependent dehydrogenase (short-subunit alcohol dehydrogenase family)